MNPELTTIRISKELRDDIAGLGSKKETYEMILRRLVTEASKK
jgi:Arc/MetJ family transcription regulator